MHWEPQFLRSCQRLSETPLLSHEDFLQDHKEGEIAFPSRLGSKRHTETVFASLLPERLHGLFKLKNSLLTGWSGAL